MRKLVVLVAAVLVLPGCGGTKPVTITKPKPAVTKPGPVATGSTAPDSCIKALDQADQFMNLVNQLMTTDSNAMDAAVRGNAARLKTELHNHDAIIVKMRAPVSLYDTASQACRAAK
jgi:hypothetical protein